VGLSARTHEEWGTARTLAGSVRYDGIHYTAIGEFAYLGRTNRHGRILNPSPPLSWALRPCRPPSSHQSRSVEAQWKMSPRSRRDRPLTSHLQPVRRVSQRRSWRRRRARTPKATGGAPNAAKYGTRHGPSPIDIMRIDGSDTRHRCPWTAGGDRGARSPAAV